MIAAIIDGAAAGRVFETRYLHSFTWRHDDDTCTRYHGHRVEHPKHEPIAIFTKLSFAEPSAAEVSRARRMIERRRRQKSQ